MANYLGDALTRSLASAIHIPVASTTALAAIPADDRQTGMLAINTADGSRWLFSSSSSAADTSSTLVVTPAAGSGRWLRMPGAMVLTLPITYATLDAAVLLTMPVGSLALIRKLYWTISADFTGGASSAIGVSSTKTGFTTKGDLLGGAAGDVAAALTSALSPANGTIGAKVDTVAELHTTLWKAADILRHDRITSAFTAGTGAVNVVIDLLANPGA
jgi:hypothetical protein